MRSSDPSTDFGRSFMARVTGVILLGMLAVGLLWWVLVLRHRLKAGTAGPPDVLAARGRRG